MSAKNKTHLPLCSLTPTRRAGILLAAICAVGAVGGAKSDGIFTNLGLKAQTGLIRRLLDCSPCCRKAIGPV
jgi:hypothetical protein